MTTMNKNEHNTDLANADAESKHTTQLEHWVFDWHTPSEPPYHWKTSQRRTNQKQMTENDLLGENIDHTPTQTLMADAANSLLGDSDVASPRASTTNSLTESELGLDLHIPCLAQVCHDARFIEN